MKTRSSSLPCCLQSLLVSVVRLSTIGGHSFQIAFAKIWNGLPTDITSSSLLLSIFEQGLKTYLLRRRILIPFSDLIIYFSGFCFDLRRKTTFVEESSQSTVIS
jgi:hypothetical protein